MRSNELAEKQGRLLLLLGVGPPRTYLTAAATQPQRRLCRSTC